MVRYKSLIEIVRDTKPRHVVEIGTWDGKRAVEFMAVSNCYYTGFDLFEEVGTTFTHDATPTEITIANILTQQESFGVESPREKGEIIIFNPFGPEGKPILENVFWDFGPSGTMVDQQFGGHLVAVKICAAAHSRSPRRTGISAEKRP